MPSWRSRYAKCPFYFQDTNKAIVCEGFFVGERIRRLFKNPEDCERIFMEFCAAHYELCPVFQLVYGTYQNGEKR